MVSGRVLEVVNVSPWSFGPDHLRFVQADRRLSERVVITVTDRADRRERAGFDQTICVQNTCVDGEFNWSSQHYDDWCFDEEVQAGAGS
jgi:hypothetical protein